MTEIIIMAVIIIIIMVIRDHRREMAIENEYIDYLEDIGYFDRIEEEREKRGDPDWLPGR